MALLDLNRNNLDHSNSQYLLDHAENPIWWQQWGKEIIGEAKRLKKPLFVSVGYSSCHWCHVMSNEAFSDKNTADYLNKNFICIKVDREERPDIDSYLMKFITAQTGSGGWPLNVFMSYDLKPFYALTYAPCEPVSYIDSFKNIAEKAYGYYIENKENIGEFKIYKDDISFDMLDVIGKLLSISDIDNGGFTGRNKFPPHTTILFLLYYLCSFKNENALKFVKKTLNMMQLRGLNDHLAGGIFRYCVDNAWTIPHFEKMLYDQVMALWCYSLAYKVTGITNYKDMAKRILNCMEGSFFEDGLYVTSFDADTDHIEGGTYIWDKDELKNILTDKEFQKLSDVYQIENKGNFKGKIHLIRKNNKSLDSIEKKLLKNRKKRVQPKRDNKFICGLNALAVISLIQTSRNLDEPDQEFKASVLMEKIIDVFWKDNLLYHSLFDSRLQKKAFLFDAGCVLTALTMLYETDKKWESLMDRIYDYIQTFKKDGIYYESYGDDFHKVPADDLDHPIPSSVSITEMGILRYRILKDEKRDAMTYKSAYHSDFHNISVLIDQGLFHLRKTMMNYSWKDIFPNSVMIEDSSETDCYMGSCRKIK